MATVENDDVQTPTVCQDLCVCRKLVLLIATCMCSMCASGIVFGWEAIEAILELEDQYTNLCPNATVGINTYTIAPTDVPSSNSSFMLTTAISVDDVEDGHLVHTCPKEEDRMNLIYTVTSAVLGISGFLIGLFLDRFGPCPTLSVGATLFLGGCTLFAFSNAGPTAYAEGQVLDGFIPGYAMIGLGGIMVSFAAMISTTMFRNEKIQRTVISLLNVLFDASSFVFGPFLSIVLAGLATRKTLFLVFACCMSGLFVITIFGWFLNRENAFGVKKQDKKRSKSRSKSVGMELGEVALLEAPPPGDEDNDLDYSEIVDDKPTQVVDMDYCQQLRTFEFATLLTFCIAHFLKVNLFLGTAHMLFETLGDEDHGWLLTSMFAYIMPASVVSVPLIEPTIRHLGIVNALQVVNFMGLLSSALAIVPILYLQIATVFIFTCYRAFCFSLVYAFAFEIFGASNFGRVQGLVQTLVATFNLVQYPLVYVADEIMGGNPLFFNIIMVGLNLPLFVLIFCLNRDRKRRYGKK